jgi:adenosylcobinamide-GDP ribazoletransferase
MSVKAPWWQEALAPPVLALQFLTAVPIPLAMPASPRHLGRAMACFPLVGALLGLALGALDAILRLALPVSVEVALLLAACVLLVGGLHLDGLMDTADGAFGGRTVERRLEIMRDSRVGSFGVLAGGLALLVEYSALVALAPPLRLPSLVLALTCARWGMALATWRFPYARPHGLGAGFKQGVTWRHTLVATILATAVAVAVAGWVGLAALAAAALLVALLGIWLSGKFGGLTGDCYGAINEAVEIARRFGGEDSAAFVNGVLDAIATQVGAKAKEKPEDAD